MKKRAGATRILVVLTGLALFTTVSATAQGAAELLISVYQKNLILRFNPFSGEYLGSYASGAASSWALERRPGGTGVFVTRYEGNLYARNMNGTADTTWGVGGMVSTAHAGAVRALSLTNLPDGSLLLGTRKTSAGGAPILRYDTATGAYLGTFAIVDEGVNDLSLASMALGPDRTLYVAGGSKVHRLDSVTGAYIDAFVPNTGAYPSSLLFLPDGDLLVARGSNTSIIRYQGPFGAAPGTLVGTFATNAGMQNIRDMLLGYDGNVWALTGGIGTSQILRFDSATGAYIDTLLVGGTEMLGGSFANMLLFMPEPGSFILLLVGFAGLATRRPRRPSTDG